MIKTKKYFGFVLILITFFAGSVYSADYWDNETGDQDWFNDYNWKSDWYPDSSIDVAIDMGAPEGPNECIVSAGESAAECKSLYVGFNAETDGAILIEDANLNASQWVSVGHRGSGTLTVTGGTLTTTSYDIGFSTSSVAPASGTISGTINLSGGSIISKRSVMNAPRTGGSGVLNISGGTISALQYDFGKGLSASDYNGEMVVNMSGGQITVPRYFYAGCGGKFTMDMTGGTVTATKQLMLGFDAEGTESWLNIHGGTFTAEFIDYRDCPAKIDFRNDGKMILTEGDRTSYVRGYVTDGIITAWDGFASVDYYYDDVNEVTVIQSGPFDPNIAIELSPQGSGILPSADLSWVNGLNSDTHTVYFGTDFEDVNDRAALVNKGSQVSPYDVVSGDLEFGQTYYWCVDESNSLTSQSWPGQIVSFTVANYVILDDFEDYNNINPATGAYYTPSERYSTVPEGTVWASWEDGYKNELSGSLLEDADGETNGGTGAVKLTYDNDGSVNINGFAWTPPYYSEISMEVNSIDFTADGATSITFDVLGSSTNSADEFYVTLYDATGSSRVVLTDSDDVIDTEAIRKAYWQTVYFPLSDFTVNVSKITKISIGVGNASSAGSSGVLYIDNLSRHLPTCVPERAIGDINCDCIVDMAEIKELSDNWLKVGSTITSVAPGTSNLVLHYDFEGFSSSVSDQAGSNDASNYNAIRLAGESFDSSDCAYFNGSSWMEVPPAAFSSLGTTGEVTVSVWVNGDDVPMTTRQILFNGRTAGNTGHILTLNMPMSVNSGIMFESGHVVPQEPDWQSWYYGWDTTVWEDVTTDQFQGNWNHFAVSKNISTGLQKIYWNGNLVAETVDADTSFGSYIQVFYLGCFIPNYSYSYNGKIDEFRVYDAELSHSEVLYLAKGNNSTIDIQPSGNGFVEYEVEGAGAEDVYYQPVLSTKANVNDSDLVVDFEDFALMASQWLVEQLWP